MVNLNIPYLSQLDNRLNPYGSCNVTSAAMALNWAGIKTNPDTLYQEMLDKGLSRHSPYDLAVMIENKGAIDTFLPNANIQDIKAHIKEGNPVIVHGYFTGFGHIIVIKGFDSHSFICHDPYGEWYSSGYQINSTKHYGKDIKYSFNLIKELCDEGGIWTHFCESKGVAPPPRPAVTPKYQGVSLQDIYHDDISVSHSEIFNIEVRVNFQIQVTLGNRYEGRRDAIFGPKTQKALNNYCQEIGVPSDPIQKPLAKILIEGQVKTK